MLLPPPAYKYLNRFITDDDLATPNTCQGQNAEAWYKERSRKRGDVWANEDQKNDTLLFEMPSVQDEIDQFEVLKDSLKQSFGECYCPLLLIWHTHFMLRNPKAWGGARGHQGAQRSHGEHCLEDRVSCATLWAVAFERRR